MFVGILLRDLARNFRVEFRELASSRHQWAISHEQRRVSFKFPGPPTPGTEGLELSRGLPGKEGGWLEVELNHA